MKRPSKTDLLICAELLLNAGDSTDEASRTAVADWLAHLGKPLKRRVRPPRKLLTAEMVRAAFTYDPATGFVRWRDEQLNEGRKQIGRVSVYGYRRIEFHGRTYLAHRLAWIIMTGAWPVHMIDHRDGNGANNRWDNLRPATHSENQRARRKYSTAMPWPKGVTFDTPTKQFRAQIKVGNKAIYLGLHHSPEAAGEAYAEAARLHFGEFASR